jgi:hypothetical protein
MLTALGIVKRTLPPRRHLDVTEKKPRVLKLNWETLDRARQNNFIRYCRKNPFYFAALAKKPFNRENVEDFISANPKLFNDEGVRRNGVWSEILR